MPSAGVWATESPTVPNSRRCRPSRSATSAARTTWLTAPWTSEPALLPSRLWTWASGHSLPYTHTSQPPWTRSHIFGPAGLGWARLGLAACSLYPQNYYFCSPSPLLPVKHNLLYIIPSPASVFCLVCPVALSRPYLLTSRSPSRQGLSISHCCCQHQHAVAELCKKHLSGVPYHPLYHHALQPGFITSGDSHIGGPRKMVGCVLWHNPALPWPPPSCQLCGASWGPLGGFFASDP